MQWLFELKCDTFLLCTQEGHCFAGLLLLNGGNIYCLPFMPDVCKEKGKKDLGGCSAIKISSSLPFFARDDAIQMRRETLN